MKTYDISLARRNAAPRTYTQLHPLDDVTIMKEVQAQNGDALAVLFDRYYKAVLGLALKILRDGAEAEDMLQKIFMEIYERAGQFDPAEGRFYIWLMQYAYHRSMNRKNYLLMRRFYGKVPLDHLTELEQGMLKRYSQPVHDCTRFVRDALSMLTEGQQRTIELVRFEGMTLKEVADRTEEPFASVQRHYYRGLARLRRYLRSLRLDTQATNAIRDLGASSV